MLQVFGFHITRKQVNFLKVFSLVLFVVVISSLQNIDSPSVFYLNIQK